MSISGQDWSEDRHLKFLNEAAKAGKWSLVVQQGYYSKFGITVYSKDRQELLSVELDRMGRVFRWTRYHAVLITATGRAVMDEVFGQSEPEDVGKFDTAILQLLQGPTGDYLQR